MSPPVTDFFVVLMCDAPSLEKTRDAPSIFVEMVLDSRPLKYGTVCVCVCVCVCVLTCTCTCARVHICLSACDGVCVGVSELCACVFWCMCVCSV